MAARRSKRKKSVLKKLFFGLITSIIILAIAEIFLDAIDAPQYESNINHFFLDQRNNEDMYVPDSDLFWLPRIKKGQGQDKYITRGITPEKKKNVFRVLCLGDSLTYGFRLKSFQSYPAKLEKILGRKGEVLNSGVCGFTIVQGSRFFDRDLWAYKPDLVFAGFGYNDNWEAFQQDTEATPLPASIWKAHKTLTKLRIFGYLASKIIDDNAGQEIVSRVSRKNFRDYSLGINNSVMANGGQLVFLLFPTINMDNNALTAPLRRPPETLEILDLRAAFDGLSREKIHASFQDDIHLTETGTTIVARYLAKWIEEKGYIKALEKGEIIHE